MRVRYKLLLIGIVWLVTLPLGGVFHFTYWKWDFAVILTYGVWERWTVLARHYLGYSVLGFFFGWFVMPLAIIDEILQYFLKGPKAFKLLHMALNIVGVVAGVGISRFIKISWRGKE